MSAPSTVRRLYRDGALADGRSDRLRLGVSILVEGGRVTWIRPSDDEGPAGDTASLEIVDASGSTVVPGLVDAHSHVTLPGGAHWIDRIGDASDDQRRYAEANARLLTQAGVRWARDVGAAPAVGPEGTRGPALSLEVRDRWRGRAGAPYVRAAGTWINRGGSLPAWSVEADDADELLAASMRQLDDGADFVKLYLDGPDLATSPWSVPELRRVVEAVHARGATVTAHSGSLAGARAGAEAGVDCLEHGFELDDGAAGIMAANGVALVATLAVLASWRTFASTTTLPRFASDEGRARVEARRERAFASIAAAHRAGVRIAAGTDFGGGSTRANQLAWEVEQLVRAGLEPWEALGSATWRGGELLGDPDAGVLREGGPADLVLVHGDPLSDPAALWRVWHVSWAA
jgi:imidazolonepropionase-like amidohydrolase